MSKNILVMGATGSMGTYLTHELLNMGYYVDGLTLDDVQSNNPYLNYIKMDCYDDESLRGILANKYDAIVDFMYYRADVFKEKRMDLLLGNTEHYIFLSSYRVYANEQIPITETAPQIYDVYDDPWPIENHTYEIEKCLGEDVLENSKYKNWTILRPSIVISSTRFPLITVETAAVINRAIQGKYTLLPEQAKNVHAAMIWAGDAGKLISRLVLNPKAMCQHYTIASSEVNTWEDIVSYYQKAIGLKPLWIDKEEHIKLMGDTAEEQNRHRRGLELDRLFDRVIDNSKVLEVTGLAQADFLTIEEGFES